MIHRAHYLQHRKSKMFYRTTCDCGWIGTEHSDPIKSAIQYSKHVNYEGPIPSSSEDEFAPEYIYISGGIRYRKDN
jgi:hypothetical protein